MDISPKNYKFSIAGYRGLKKPVEISLSTGKVVEIAGVNGSGKSSISNGVMALLTADLSPPFIAPKRSKEVINDKSPCIDLQMREGSSSRLIEWKKGKPDIIEDGSLPKMPADILKIRELLNEVGDAAGKSWQSLLGYKITEEMLRERISLIMDGYQGASEITDAILNELSLCSGGHWIEAEAIARDRGANLKRDWEEAVASYGDSERYGSKKAASWRPSGWDDNCIRLGNSTKARKEMSEFQVELEKAQRVSYAEEIDIKARSDAEAARPAVDLAIDEKREEIDQIERSIAHGSVLEQISHMLSEKNSLEAKVDIFKSSLAPAKDNLERAEAADRDYISKAEKYRESVARRENAEKTAKEKRERLTMEEDRARDRVKREAGEISRRIAELDKEISSLKEAKEAAGQPIPCPACKTPLAVIGDSQRFIIERARDQKAVDKAEKQKSDLSSLLAGLQDKINAAPLQHLVLDPSPPLDAEPDARARPSAEEISRLRRDEYSVSSKLTAAEDRIRDINRKVDDLRSLGDESKENDNASPDRLAREKKNLEALRDRMGEIREILHRVHRDAIVARPGQQKKEDIESSYTSSREALVMLEVKENADLLARQIYIWTSISHLLSPQGLRADLAAESLEWLNGKMAEMADFAEWPEISIKSDPWQAEINSRDASVASASEQWRAALLIQAAIAKRNKCPLLIVDGLDILTDRGAGRSLLAEIADSWSFAVLVLTAASSRDAVPTDVLWLNDGRLQ